MSRPRPDALSPAQAAAWLEAMPPVEVKTRLLDYLLWQAAHGKILLHSAHYFRLLHYGYRPREETSTRREAPLRAMAARIGRPVV